MPDEIKARVLAGERITVEIVYPNGVAGNVLATGTGALNVDGCRVATDEDCARRPSSRVAACTYAQDDTTKSMMFGGRGHIAGRWPANLCHDGSPEVLEAFAAFGERPGKKPARLRRGSTTGAGLGYHGSDFQDADIVGRGDTGTAARFFYSAKASKAERAGSKHPTVKPLALMRWLCRLVTPPGGTVLDCFAGTGVTGEACLREGFSAVLIEKEEAYVADIHARLARHRDEAPLLAEVAA